MLEPIDFYFDFASPYGYFASLSVDDLAARHGRNVTWRPFLLGAAFKLSGMQPLVAQAEIRAWYFPHDWQRIARRLKRPFQLADGFPHAAVASSRAFYWLHDQDPKLAKDFARRIYQAYFGEGRDFTSADMVAGEAAALGVDRGELLAALNDPAVKERLKTEVDAALSRRVFGSPTFIVDGELFWGHDRMADVEEWLKTGGW